MTVAGALRASRSKVAAAQRDDCTTQRLTEGVPAFAMDARRLTVWMPRPYRVNPPRARPAQEMDTALRSARYSVNPPQLVSDIGFSDQPISSSNRSPRASLH